MVHSQVLSVQQARAPRVYPLPQHVRGAEGTRAESAQSSEPGREEQGATQNQGWTGPWEPIRSSVDDRSGSRRGGLGLNQRPEPGGRESQRSALRCDRGGLVADHESASGTDPSDAESKPRIKDHARTLMLLQCLEELKHVSKNPQITTMAETDSKLKEHTNHVWKEMFFLVNNEQHGFLDSSQRLLMSQHPLIDCLEIYCSDESQLTHQYRQQGLRAMRFTLKDGDLGTSEGRQKLYHVIFRYRPRHIWVSPRCKAWCRWNQFNALKSPAAAQRVLQAREHDEVHLQLCEATFLHQHRMGSLFHFHLEQPVGSDMLYEDTMQSIVECLHRTRCDLCRAGDLKHPISRKHLQKGTQIFSSSMIMSRQLEQLGLHVVATMNMTKLQGVFKHQMGPEKWSPNIPNCIPGFLERI